MNKEISKCCKAEVKEINWRELMSSVIEDTKKLEKIEIKALNEILKEDTYKLIDSLSGICSNYTDEVNTIIELKARFQEQRNIIDRFLEN